MPRTHKKSYIPTAIDRDILELVYKWRYVTADQIRRYRKQSENSLHDIQRRLKILVEEGYLYPCRLWRDTPAGRLPFVYTLDTAGVTFLTDLGLDAKKYFRSDRKHNPALFPHNLAVNEVALAAIALCEQEPRITLHKVLHDWELKGAQYRVTLFRDTPTARNSESVEFVPDLWLDFRITTNEQTMQACLFIEVDMDTYTSRERFQKKIAAYCEFINSGQYSQTFHTTSVGIAYLTPKGDARRDEMKLLCEQQLRHTPVWRPTASPGEHQSGMNDTGLFLFGAVLAGSLNPIDTFLSPITYAPFDTHPQPLLQL